MDWLFCLGVGAVAGLVAGMTGSGTGFLLIPGLTLALALVGIGGSNPLKMAIATAQGALLISAFAAFQAHTVRRTIAWGDLLRLTPGAMAGGAGGALLAMELDRAVIDTLFVAIALTVGVTFLRRPVHPPKSLKERPSFVAISLRLFMLGATAAVTGAGGLLSPYLRSFVPIHKVVGTSAAAALVIITPAVAVSYVLSSTQVQCRLDCVGAVFLPGVFATGLSAALAAPLGAWFSHTLPGSLTRKGFAVLVLGFAAFYTLKLTPATVKAASAAMGLSDNAAQSSLEAAVMPQWLLKL